MVNLSTTQKLIIAFIALIIGIVLLPTIATQGNLVTDRISIKNESHSFTYAPPYTNQTNVNYTVTNAPTGWKSQDCPIVLINITNNNSRTLVEGTDFIIERSTGVYGLYNTTVNNQSVGVENNTYITYTYCPDDYMNLSWGRTGIKLVPGFISIALLLISVGLFYNIAREQGIIGR